MSQPISENLDSNTDTLQLNYSGIKKLSERDVEKLSAAKIKCLILKRNLLRELPSCFGQLTTLVQLHLSNNELESLPAEIGDLISLEVLDVAGNRLKDIPTTICRLHNIRKLNISDNKIACIPKEVGCLQRMRTLEASRNLLQTVPIELSQCLSLELLALDKNHLTSLPRQLGKLTNLTELSLCGNHLEYLPHKALKDLWPLSALYVDNNPAFATFPVFFAWELPFDLGMNGCSQPGVPLNARFQHIFIDSLHLTIPEEIQQVCVPGENCVPSLQELALRVVDKHCPYSFDRGGWNFSKLPIPGVFKELLLYPTDSCDECTSNMFLAAFPAVFIDIHFANPKHMVGFFCSLGCLKSISSKFKIIYPFKSEA